MTSVHADWLRPAWTLAGVDALMTTRAGGVSEGAFASLNLRDGIGDEPAHVAHNQSVLAAAVGTAPVWLNQVHGTQVVRLTGADTHPGAPVHTADASVTTEPGVACAVQVADCLPVLFVAPARLNGGRERSSPRAAVTAVGAAHAGWRGLAAGVLEATLAALCDAAGCAPSDVQAWLGACIGPRRFEVGPDVLQAFGAAGRIGGDADGTDESLRFVPQVPGKWLANLPLLARYRLQAAGVRDVSGGTWCTVENPSRFFSYRRDRATGRMAAVVRIDGGAGR